MKIAVFGKNGQVATELQRRVPEGVTLQVVGRDEADFADPAMVGKVALSLNVDAIINAVAYTAVDKAEEEPELAHTVNDMSVGVLGSAAAKIGVPLVHISTDYVFPGDGSQPWHPKDDTGPLGVYGTSKLLGETALRDSGAQHVTLRTSWVFSAHGNNFVKTMLRLSADRPELTVVADQIGGPTPAAAIADACFTLTRALKDGHEGGTYHFSGAPDMSWADFAREIMAQAQLSTKIADIPASDYPTPAKRPLNSRLDCTSLERDFSITRPDWREGLKAVLKELRA
ncbi:MAG: dTDP-4-dehydrorhamnose reductase [Pseudomonadota bacterium]